ncbi:LPS export ABC transporter permease LptG [Conchiformibius kuhniae]|uniref:LPS export ABC transporter permease LptG n=2 Tax=Conchiformibius kuhniae TaxID=211502 RepID=A0A8T9MZ77_9NEIS|nr:LPS export ABC transporter permease LptG [Conchiformibius kuhniae]UOP05686.1 LPS export ABC transporter permease LptG [Conchiformibius kuhniae]
MKLLTRYVVLRLGKASLLALMALVSLYGFFDLLGEAGNIGKGTYTTATAFQYVLLQMPARAYLLMPLAVLTGALFAFGRLAADCEWAVVKTSGVDTWGIVRMVLVFGGAFAVATALLGEWAAPEMSRRADALKAAAKSGQVLAAQDGIWIKENGSMVYVASVLPDNGLTGVKIWRYGDDFRLQEAISAPRARVGEGQWLLFDSRSSRITPERVETVVQPQRVWASGVGRALLATLQVKPEQMSWTALGRYIRHLEHNRQQTQMYRVAWWNKLVYPAAVVVMALLALAFTPVSGRHANMGLKLFGGVCLGLLFYFSGRLFGFTSRLYGVPAWVAALLPTAAFAVWALVLIRRQERR